MAAAFEPMLAAPTTSPRLPPGFAAEPKWDGFRALLTRGPGGQAHLTSRRGTDLTPDFPEIIDAAAELPEAPGEIIFDGELVIWNEGRLEFELLLQRHGRRRATITAHAARHPATYVAFDLLHRGETELRPAPWRQRRAELESLFATYELAAPFTLCPWTTDPSEVELWLTAWTEYGIEGVCFKRLDEPYLAGRRAWRKYRIRESAEGIIGAITETLANPSTLLLGRLDRSGRLRFIARTTPLDRTAAARLAPLLTPADDTHPWHARKPAPRWNPPDPEDITLVAPEMVAEFSGDLARDPRGVFRHLVRFARPRPDLAPADTPPATAGREPTAG